MRCAVVGSPIAHSLSPVMHTAAYAELGLAWCYTAEHLDSEDLAGFLAGLGPDWRGLSLTMPLKRTVVPLVDSLDAWSRFSGVVNTLLLTEGRRLGFNTDIPGAMGALIERVHDPVRSVTVLGGGATAASVLLALVELGCTSARLLVRDPARAEETVRTVAAHSRAPSVTVGVLDDTGPISSDLVVSTVPAAAQTPDLVAACAGVPAVFEVVYDPWLTPLVRAAQASDQILVGGLDLLAHQAVLQVQLMTGRSVGVDLLRSAALAELGRRGMTGAR